MNPEYHALTVEEVLSHVEVDPETGLTDEEASRRLQKYGRNVLSGEVTESLWVLLFNQVANSMTFVLIVATVLAFVTQDFAEAVVILIIIIANTFIGFYQDYKAEKTMAALRSMASPTANVLRNREPKTITATEVVPGDIVLLKSGDNVGADCRLIDCHSLAVDEALLTGETHQVDKHVDPIRDARVPTGDQHNMVFASTTVTKGRGRGVAVRTGMLTEIGKIAKSMFETKVKQSKTPLQQSLSNMGLVLLAVAIVLAFIVFAVNHFNVTVNILLYAVAVAIAVIPEGLMAIVTLTMALGMRQMSKQQVLVRKLIALELLGRVTNVCSDKTGTLTQAIMTVTKIWMPGYGFYSDEDVPETASAPTEQTAGQLASIQSLIEIRIGSFQSFGRCASLCNMAELKFDANHRLVAGIGDATEIALQKFAQKHGIVKQKLLSEQGWELWVEQTFDSQYKRMSVIYQNPFADGAVIFTKGAPERVLSRCMFIQRGDQVHPVSFQELSNEVQPIVQLLSSQGMRTIALATRALNHVTSMEAAKRMPRKEIESQLTLIGLAGITDPPRPESKVSVAMCHDAGITVHMLTGDHLLTAVSIARQVGILPSLDDETHHDEARYMLDEEKDLVMTSTEFDNMTDNQINALHHLPKVIARCSPQTKVRMIQAIHRRGYIAAMTGDGVNDSPSLKLADVGISMGQNSSDVAKQASDIVLTDNNFANIVNGIAEGRRIFRNIQRFVVVLVGGNVAELFVLMIGLVFTAGGLSVFPLSPIQILVNNLVTGTPSALALGMEKKSPETMRQPPRSAKSGLFDLELITDINFFGCVIGAITLFDFYATLQWFGNGILAPNCDVYYTAECDNLYRARGVAFAVLTILILLHTYNCRDLRGRVWNKAGMTRFFENHAITGAVVFGCIVVIVSLYVPSLNNKVFKQLGFGAEWGLVFASIFVFIVISDLYKCVKSRILPRFQSLPSSVSL